MARCNVTRRNDIDAGYEIYVWNEIGMKSDDDDNTDWYVNVDGSNGTRKGRER